MIAQLSHQVNPPTNINNLDTFNMWKTHIYYLWKTLIIQSYQILLTVENSYILPVENSVICIYIIHIESHKFNPPPKGLCPLPAGGFAPRPLSN